MEDGLIDNRILFVKILGGLRPAEPRADEWLMRIKIGKIVAVEQPKLQRNPDHHRLYWALVDLVWNNIDHDRYPSRDDLHAALKISAGLRTRLVLPNGEIGFIPGSIAFNKMGQVEFSEFFDRMCDQIAKYFLPGVTSVELKREVEQMIGVTTGQLEKNAGGAA